jgi:hypothetical protein
MYINFSRICTKILLVCRICGSYSNCFIFWNIKPSSPLKAIRRCGGATGSFFRIEEYAKQGSSKKQIEARAIRLQKAEISLWTDVFTTTVMKISIIWNRTSCSAVKVNRRFRGTPSWLKSKSSKKSTWKRHQTEPLFFLRNAFWLSPGCTALYPKIQNSSENLCLKRESISGSPSRSLVRFLLLVADNLIARR